MVNRRLKFLAVDDNPDNLITLKALIQEAFPRDLVFTALGGPQCLMLAGKEDPDVILLDVIMPGMDGFEVCRKLKEDKDLRDIPVVFVTAIKGDKEHRILALECGAESFLAKPIDETELTAQLCAMVKIKTANMEKQDEKGRLARLVEEKTSELKKAHLKTIELFESLKESEENNRLLITQMEQGLAVHELIVDKNGKAEDYRFIYINDSFERLTGLKRKEILGNVLSEIMPDSKKFLLEKYASLVITREPMRYERYFEQFKKYFEVVAYSPKPGQIAVILSDITDRKKKEDEITYLIYHDYLTGLYNRRFYEEELIRLDIDDNQPITLVMADVNGLKLINDSFGHALGDLLLKKSAEAIIKGSRKGDIIARLGGDEFVIILPNTDAFEADQIIMRIKEHVSKEEIGAIKLSISFGKATKHHCEEDIQEVLKKAEDNMYRYKLYESASIRSKTIDLIMNTLYEKSSREMLHSKRVSEICENIAVAMKFDQDHISQIRTAGLIHDIGKMGIDEKILNKPDKLNNDEWKEITRHPEIGYRILSASNEFLYMANSVFEHQERWDGKGYPKGLKGKEISLAARIIAVADAYDAMTSDRAYRKGLSETEAVEEIRQCSGTQFDPEVTRVFIEKVLKKGTEI